MNETQDTNRYGAYETNGLVNGAEYHEQVDYSRTYTLAEVKAEGGRITRVRLLTESINGQRFADVSYIHATLPNGKTVNVQNGLDNLTPMKDMMGQMIQWGKREGVFAKGIGLLDKGNWSVL